MGKCSKCGKKIEYNNFVVVNGIVYHRECAPAKECDVNNKIAEERDINNKIAKECDINNKIAKPKKRRKSRKVKKHE